MAFLITKEAYNVLNNKLPDMVYSVSSDHKELRFAHYFERYMNPIQYTTWQEAYEKVCELAGDKLLYNANNSQLYMLDGNETEIYESAFSIVDITLDSVKL